MTVLPAARPATRLRVLATTDLGASLVPIRTSYGLGGTCAGIVTLLERERERQPTLWLDAGDLVVGPAGLLLGERPWADIGALPVDAAAAGNHEFDDGVPALLDAVPGLGFPLLCANADLGLPSSVLLGEGLGVIGLTHPHADRLSRAPRLAAGWRERVAPLAAELRGRGAEWVVVLLHDGVDWWPSGDPGDPVAARPDRLARQVAPWADAVDLIIGGHVVAGWTGTLAGTPAAHAAIFAASVAVIDLPEPPARAEVRGVFPVPPERPRRRSAAVDALDAAGAEVAGESAHDWVARPGAARYLPDLIAETLRVATGADAGFALAGQHATQGALDGVVAAFPAGPVTRLDLARLFPYDDRPAVAELRPGELAAAVAAHDAHTDPLARGSDGLWWNWARMRAGVAAGPGEPRTVALVPFAVPRLGELLGRELTSRRVDVSLGETLLRVVR
jgi:2',3'-cyclic-nucleotide 2'-phosphodiesterase (5'-nucleotidase family)